MRLIYFSPVPWTSFAQRPQKFVEWFHLRTGGEVLWVDPYPTRLPQLSDFRRPDPPNPEEAQEHYSWLRLVKPRAFPVEPIPVVAWLNRLLWGGLLNHLRDFSRDGDTLIVAGKPSLLALTVLDGLPGVPSFYDAMDEFPAFYKGLSRLSMARHEKRLVRRVDRLWVTSTRLKQRWCQECPDLEFVPNGFDPAHIFHPQQKDKEQTGKVFGYVGTIASWFDWNWVVQLAISRPEDTIRLIGPIYTAAQTMLPNNIQMLPPCNHVDAMEALQDFDVGIIPFKRNELTDSVDPIKYYEYRASGLPVISTDFGEMSFRGHEPGTFISQSPSDISELASQALKFIGEKGESASFVRSHSWSARFDNIHALRNIVSAP